MENDFVVVVKDLRKTYGDTKALDGISFNIKKGEIFGLLGPNGAGKTTTLECIEGLRKPDGGSFSLMGLSPGHDHINMRNMIGVQLQVSGLPGTMRVNEAINFFCAYHKVAPRNDLLERLGLVEKINTQYQFLSTGQQRRLATSSFPPASRGGWHWPLPWPMNPRSSSLMNLQQGLMLGQE